MKKVIYLCLLLICVGCVTSTSKATTQESTSEGFTKVFNEYGFSVTTPCVLEEGTFLAQRHVGENIEADYYGIDHPDDTVNTTGYQVVVHKVPKNCFEDEAKQNEYMEQMKASGVTNVEKVIFSDNKYIGFVGDKYQNGTMSRMVMFNKGDNLITLMVSANKDLDQKFKTFTDSFIVTD